MSALMWANVIIVCVVLLTPLGFIKKALLSIGTLFVNMAYFGLLF